MGRLAVRSIISFATAAALLLTSCTSITATKNGDRAIITDRTGREWDVTHARDVYGMSTQFFNYGLGIGAIPSVDNPTVLQEGDLGYPDSNSPRPVFGVSHNGEQRAYSVRALKLHEVFNDIYPGESNQYLAVAY